MDSFDLARLTDFDFENVCKDLFESHLGVKLEIFAPGADQGIDLRCFASEASLIIQCKNWNKTKRAALIRYMEKVERPKIEKLNPARYILATSVSLTVNAKNQLAKILAPYVLAPSDIYGLFEIEALLREKPEIVARHLRLWLSSAQVLQSLFNKKIITRSADLTGDLERSMQVYVPNESYNRAREILEKEHVCIVSGIPGIGKTTLAQVLAATYGASSYELYEISEDADEINSLWDDDIPQFFYYDDFLGQNTLDDKLHKNEDSRLLKILRRVNRSPNKRMVMTTREYIIKQARQRYERIDQADFNPWTCVLALRDYTRLIRAEILYNHVYYSSLSPADKAVFAEPDVYKEIIHHQNFNPRLINYSLQAATNEGISGRAIAQKVVESLKNPASIWDHIVTNQVDDVSRDILTCLFLLPRPVALSYLPERLEEYSYEARGEKLSAESLRRGLKVLEGTMTRTSQHNGAAVVNYHNPSIADYMRSRIFNEKRTLISILQCIRTFDEIANLLVLRTWPDVVAALEDLDTKGVLSDAVLRTYGGRERFDGKIPASVTDAIYGRCSVALQIADEFDLQDVINEVIEWVRLNEIYNICPNPEDIVALVKQISTSKSPKIAELLPLILEDALQYITDDLGTWDNANFARELLAELGDLVPEAILQHVEDALERIAEYTLERMAETGWSPDPPELEQIVDYAESISRSDDSLPGLEAAAEIVRQRRSGHSQPSVYSPRSQVIRDLREMDMQVEQMLSALRAVDEPDGTT